MMLQHLIKLANTLDAAGHYIEAAKIDLLIKTAIKLEERFWSKVKKNPGKKGCWEWQGAKDSHGYGILTMNGKNYMAHKLSWEVANGRKVPKGMVLLHSCDVRNCLNPAHLTPGSQQSNMDDRGKKGRTARGPQNGKALLKQKDIKAIRMLKSKGLTETAIAILYNVARSTIANILHSRTWGWA